MQNRTRVLIAAAVAAVLGTAGLTGAAYADRNKSGHSWYRGSTDYQHGKHHRMGHRGHGDMQAMRERARNFADRYDADKDGKVTQAEIDANRSEWFKKYDANSDGKLSIDEYKNLWTAAMHRKMVRSFQQLDVDGTGAITEEIYVQPMANFVEMMDRNGDGALSRDDMRGRGRHDRGSSGASDDKDQNRLPATGDDSGTKSDSQQ